MVTILVIPAALGCAAYSETPPDELPIVTDAVETASQFAANQILMAGNLDFNLQDAVAKAFQRTAAIKLEYHQTNTSLPDPSGCFGCPDWPDPIQYVSFYQTYAANHHDETKYPWVVFYVNHTVANSTTECSAVIYNGLTNRAGDNAVATDPAQRYTFVFLTDIKRQAKDLCAYSDQQFQNYMNHVVAHEYGHQRAGLTENVGTYTNLYHRGRLPQGRSDVMGFNPADFRAHPDPVFDSFGDEIAGDHSTCRGNLLTNR